ncbi:hypothetical protein ACOBWA_05535 [Psychrobacter sp. ER1]|uniref:hypothetical protein n=1 Tax=Psychrobacter sp. ER1 TaxID=3406645 RepID=UPI003B42DDB1
MTDSNQSAHEQAVTETGFALQRVPEALSTATTIDEMKAQFARLQMLSRTQPINDWGTRTTQLDNLEVMLSDNQESFAKAISADFGYRSQSETQFAELFPSFTGISHAKNTAKNG